MLNNIQLSELLRRKIMSNETVQKFYLVKKHNLLHVDLFKETVPFDLQSPDL